MDSFKLLSRSSNIQRRDHIKERLSQKVPSANSKESRDETSTAYGQRVEHIRPSKRKKQSASPQGLKSDEISVDSQASRRAESTHQSPVYPKASKAMAASLSARMGLMDEVERRRLLKQHKIKLVRLTCDQSNPKLGPEGGRTSHAKPPAVPVQLLLQFSDLQLRYGISPILLQNLMEQGFRVPTEVQMASIPFLMDAAQDSTQGPRPTGQLACFKRSSTLISVAPTGSGKTIAFMLPAIHSLIKSRAEIRSSTASGSHTGFTTLILAPTYELVDQIVNEGKTLCRGAGIRIAALKKNSKQPDSAVALDLSNGEATAADGRNFSCEIPILHSDILVSTPKILVERLAKEDVTSLPKVNYLAFDEADVLLDKLFREESIKLWQSCDSPALQTSFWSATMSSSVENLIKECSTSDSRRSSAVTKSKPNLTRLVVGLKDSAVSGITHQLTYAANERGKLHTLRQFLRPSATAPIGLHGLQPPFLVFTQSIDRAIALHKELLYDIPVEAGGSSRIAVIHSKMSDVARARTMSSFRENKIWILITTDLLSRGIDFRGMNGIVNYDIPTSIANYVHRIGRTGRQGRSGGVAVTIYTKEDIPYLKNIAKIVRASEGVTSKNASQDPKVEPQEWLIHSLPDVSQRMRRRLKERGVDAWRDKNGRHVIAVSSGARSRLKLKQGQRTANMNGKDCPRSQGRQGTSNGRPDSNWEGFMD